MKKHLTNLMKRGFAAILGAMMLTALVLPAGPFVLTARAEYSNATLALSLGNGSNAFYQMEAVNQDGEPLEIFKTEEFWAGVMAQSGVVGNGVEFTFYDLIQKYDVVPEENPFNKGHYEYEYTEYVDGGYRAKGLLVDREAGGFRVIDENGAESDGIGSGKFIVHLREKTVGSDRIHIEAVNGNNGAIDGRVKKQDIVDAFLNNTPFQPESFIDTSDGVPYKVLSITLQQGNGLPVDVAGTTIYPNDYKSKNGDVTLNYRLKDVHFNLRAVTERGEEIEPGNLGAFYELAKFESDVMNADANANPEFVFSSYAETQAAMTGMKNRNLIALKEVYIENDPSKVVTAVAPFKPVDGKLQTHYMINGEWVHTENRDVTLVFETNESAPVPVNTYNWENGTEQLGLVNDETFFDVTAFRQKYEEYYNAKGVENTLHIADFSKHMMRKYVNGASEWVASPDGKAHLGEGDGGEGVTHEIIQATVHRKSDGSGHRVQVTDIVFGADGSVTFYNNGKEVGKRRDVANWINVYFYENLVTQDKEFTKIPTVDSWSEEIYLYMFDYNMASEPNKFLGYGNGGYGQYKEHQALDAEARNADWGYKEWNGEKKAGMTELLMGQRYAGKGNLFPKLNETNNTLAMWFDPEEGGAADQRMKKGDIHGIYKANYLFTKDELGYYRYDSALNYARLRTDLGSGDNDVYNFEVYDQIATPNESWLHLTANEAPKSKAKGQLPEFFFQRGNFMPFNSMQKVQLPVNEDGNGNVTEFSRNDLINLTHGISKFDANGRSLEQSASNYNKAIYQIQEDRFNYRNGMYMVTDFLQPAGGKVSGEDMVFNFTGDDDMWVYIDGVLVLDLGGIHDAQTGRINFATGEVTYTLNWNEGAQKPRFVERHTTIRDQFKAAGQENLAQWGTGEYENTFSNYSTHRFQVFYMERGLSASNLQIEFNLMPAPKNFVAVEKEIEGMPEGVTDEAEFEFQLQYYNESKKDWVPYPNAEFTKELSNTARKELGIGESMTLGRFNMMANRQLAGALQTKLGDGMEKNSYDFATRVNDALSTGSTLRTDENGMFKINVMERAVFRTLHMNYNAEYIRVVEMVPDNTHSFNYYDDPTYQFVRAEKDSDTNEPINDGTGDYTYLFEKTENGTEWTLNPSGAYQGVYNGTVGQDGDLTGKSFDKALEKRGNVLPENGTILVVVKNKVDLREGIRLQKNVTGGYGAKEHGFSFTVELMDKDGQPFGERDLKRLRILHGRETLNVGSNDPGLAPVDYTADEIEEMRDVTVLQKTVFKFELKSREYVIFERLPENVQFKVVEVKAGDPEAQGYITTHKVTIKKHQVEDVVFKRETKDLTQEDRVGDYTATYKGEDIIKLDDNTDFGAEVIVTNNRDIVRTGLNMSTVPFILMVSFAALAIGGLAVITLRRRSMNIDD